MRSIFALLAAILATTSVHAATIYTGTIPQVDGNNYFASNLPETYLFGPGVTKVTFDIDTGIIEKFHVALIWKYNYSIFDPSLSPGIDFGNESTGGDGCSYGFAPSGCEGTYSGTPARFVSNFSGSSNHIEYLVTVPQGYDNCNPSNYGQVCAEHWNVYHIPDAIDGILVADKPVSYTLRFDNLSAVPEPANWAMMIVGFGAVGAALRRSRTRRSSTARA